MTHYDLAGRTVLITGSTGGLGSALARALRGRGARLALLDLDAEAVTSQARSLGPDHAVHGWVANVRDMTSLQEAMDAAARHFGRLDVVIANAGLGSIAPLETLSEEEWERMIDTNLSGVWRTFRAALPHVKRHQGYLLAVSSMAAFVHSPLNGPYVASKAGVWALCDATRLEVRHEGVGVGSVHPTFFATPMMDEVHANPAGNTIWSGNARGLWKMVPISTVVDATVKGIEKRSSLIIPSRSNALPARVPGLIRPLIDRIGFRRSAIRTAVDQAKKARDTRLSADAG